MQDNNWLGTILVGAPGTRWSIRKDHGVRELVQERMHSVTVFWIRWSRMRRHGRLCCGSEAVILTRPNGAYGIASNARNSSLSATHCRDSAAHTEEWRF